VRDRRQKRRGGGRPDGKRGRWAGDTPDKEGTQGLPGAASEGLKIFDIQKRILESENEKFKKPQRKGLEGLNERTRRRMRPQRGWRSIERKSKERSSQMAEGGKGAQQAARLSKLGLHPGKERGLEKAVQAGKYSKNRRREVN